MGIRPTEEELLLLLLRHEVPFKRLWGRRGAKTLSALFDELFRKECALTEEVADSLTHVRSEARLFIFGSDGCDLRKLVAPESTFHEPSLIARFCEPVSPETALAKFVQRELGQVFDEEELLFLGGEAALEIGDYSAYPGMRRRHRVFAPYFLVVPYDVVPRNPDVGIPIWRRWRAAGKEKGYEWKASP